MSNDDNRTQTALTNPAQLQATLSVIPAHTWYAASSGGLTFVNQRTADYLGLPKDHPLRFGIDIDAQWDAHIPLFHPDDREETRRVWLNCLRTGEVRAASRAILKNDENVAPRNYGRNRIVQASDNPVTASRQSSAPVHGESYVAKTPILFAAFVGRLSANSFANRVCGQSSDAARRAWAPGARDQKGRRCPGETR
jgi:PAS domain-containing protein